MNVIMHADDLGISEGVTDAIIRTYKDGCLDRTALVANGVAFEYAVCKLRENSGLAWTVHLNLFEGRPLAPPEKVSALLNSEGYFRYSMPMLLLDTVFRSSRLREQIRTELAYQLARVQDAFPAVPLAVDGHIHGHMIPLVFDTLLALKGRFNITEIRIPREPMYATGRVWYDLKNYCSANILKHVLLRILSRRGIKKLRGSDTAFRDYFVGLLYTGNMSEGAVTAALDKIARTAPGARVEVLLHPGGASAGDRDAWRAGDPLAAFYYSSERSRELAVLLSPAVREYLQRIRRTQR